MNHTSIYNNNNNFILKTKITPEAFINTDSWVILFHIYMNLYRKYLPGVFLFLLHPSVSARDPVYLQLP
jgi:hypothetical protein